MQVFGESKNINMVCVVNQVLLWVHVLFLFFGRSTFTTIFSCFAVKCQCKCVTHV